MFGLSTPGNCRNFIEQHAGLCERVQDLKQADINAAINNFKLENANEKIMHHLYISFFAPKEYALDLFSCTLCHFRSIEDSF